MQFCFHQACVFVSMLDQRYHSMYIDVRSCFQGVSAGSADKFFSRSTAKRVLFTHSCPTSKSLQTALV